MQGRATTTIRMVDLDTARAAIATVTKMHRPPRHFIRMRIMPRRRQRRWKKKTLITTNSHTIIMRAGMFITRTKRWHTISLAAILLSLIGSSVHAGSGHDNGAGGHDDHGSHEEEEGRGTLVVTHFTGQSELFLEFPALVAGLPSRFLAHFTDLRDF